MALLPSFLYLHPFGDGMHILFLLTILYRTVIGDKRNDEPRKHLGNYGGILPFLCSKKLSCKLHKY
jgi:hypothetical protein